jgi:hypothetical protein
MTWSLCACLLAACMTVTELRQSPPARVATVAGRYLALATCSMTQMETLQTEDRVRYQLLHVSSTRTATILGTARMPGGLFYTVPEPVFELSFRETAENTVTVESRNGYGGHLVEQRAWPIVEGCAGAKLTIVPPLG